MPVIITHNSSSFKRWKERYNRNRKEKCRHHSGYNHDYTKNFHHEFRIFRTSARYVFKKKKLQLTFGIPTRFSGEEIVAAKGRIFRERPFDEFVNIFERKNLE